MNTSKCDLLFLSDQGGMRRLRLNRSTLYAFLAFIVLAAALLALSLGLNIFLFAERQELLRINDSLQSQREEQNQLVSRLSNLEKFLAEHDRERLASLLPENRRSKEESAFFAQPAAPRPMETPGARQNPREILQLGRHDITPLFPDASPRFPFSIQTGPAAENARPDGAVSGEKNNESASQRSSATLPAARGKTESLPQMSLSAQPGQNREMSFNLSPKFTFAPVQLPVPRLPSPSLVSVSAVDEGIAIVENFRCQRKGRNLKTSFDLRNNAGGSLSGTILYALLDSDSTRIPLVHGSTNFRINRLKKIENSFTLPADSSGDLRLLLEILQEKDMVFRGVYPMDGK